MCDEKVEFKYRAEYSKSNRASCKGCKIKIEKDVLRLAVLVQSHHFDGKVPHWYHETCFYKKQKPTNTGDVENFESLKWDDQEKIRTMIAERLGAPVAETGKKTSKKAAKQKASAAAARDFCVEYAKSSRAMCRGCEIKIAKDEVRISKKDYESEDAVRYGGKDLWHHVECFSKLRTQLEYFESGEMLPGYNSLSKEDKSIVKKALPQTKPEVKDEVDGEPGTKKIKKEDNFDDEVMKKQSKSIYKYKDILKDLSKTEIQELLEYNGQADRSSPDSRIEHLADCMAFGALEPCQNCKGGQYVFKSSVGYECRGYVSDFCKCLKVERAPKRTAFKIPKDLKETYPSLKKYKCVVGERKIVFRDLPSTSVKMEVSDETDAGPKVERFAPLKSLSFFIIGKLNGNRETLKRTIVKLGGTLNSTFSVEGLTAVISNEAEIEKCSDKMERTKIAGIHVIPESFFEECVKGEDVSDLITKMAISPWGSNIQSRVLAAKLNSAAMKSQKSKSMFTKSVPSKVTLKLQEGLAVDPESELEETTSIYIDKKLGPFTVILSKSDIQTGKNSFYKMQLLTNKYSPLNKKYYVFRHWGRIGTTIGGKKTDKFNNLEEAKKLFFFHYLERTGNEFEEKDNFKKIPGRYCPVDVDYGQADNAKLILKSEVPSKLHTAVQNLVSMLFDVDIMKKVMMEFELDLEKMPLGKLSKKQIMTAFGVLSELQKKDGDIKPNIVIDATNRFYTLIPHSFGMDNPTKLDNKEIIQSKIEMLESLLEMETAYSMLKETSGEGDGDTHPIDKHYTKLNTNIEVVERGTDEYVLVDTYIKNTHGETHKTYELELIELFKVKRQGEEKRFKPFRKLHNRMLLWHGSRLTNFVGILSQGLRIAPPEAPVTGYMFGKGIYFADMVSKSANYCMSSRGNDVGLLLLCEVALGDMYERTQADYIQKLPPGKHSTKGVGVTAPDPACSVKLESGVEVPSGKGIKAKDFGQTSLLYNEYIVYDPAQVKAQYLLKVKFNYKY